MVKVSREMQKGRATGFPSINIVHERIHRGQLFVVQLVDEALANNGNLDILVRPNGRSLHARGSAQSGGDARIRIYENTTFSAAGSIVTPIDRNRVTKNAVTGLFTSAPTITDVGDQLAEQLVPGGSGFFTTGGSAQTWNEWVLDKDGTYLVRLTNVSGSVQIAHLEIDFYEGQFG